MRYKLNIYLLLLAISVFGCVERSTPLVYDNLINTVQINGNNRDMIISDSTLFVAGEDEGLVIYNLSMDKDDSLLYFNSLFKDSLYFSNLDLSGVLYSKTLREVFVLDKFYSIKSSKVAPLLVDSIKTQFNNIGGFLDNEHPSRFSINDIDFEVELFSVIRNKSGQVGVSSDIVSIYETDIIYIDDETTIYDNKLIIDSLIYDVTDIHYQENNLFISNTSNIKFEFRKYSRIDNFQSDDYIAIEVPYLPKCIYANDRFVFVGMLERGGVIIYRISNMEAVLEAAKGFSIREVYWDQESNLLLLSCGYQGIVIMQLDNEMNEVNSWLISSSYAYSSRYYKGYILVSTKNGIEGIKFK